jgi:hypothetical protein
MKNALIRMMKIGKTKKTNAVETVKNISVVFTCVDFGAFFGT